MDKVYTVSEITRILKELIEENIPSIWVSGEISNFKRHSSGHLYFSLKDENAQIKCVMFRTYVKNFSFNLEDGLKVKVYGKIGVYESWGSYQLYAEEILPAGIGDLAARFELLKAKLKKEGLFAPEHKKTLPEYPERIGVITSLEGAAVRDILRILKRRMLGESIIIRPALVQGEKAAMDIAQAIREFNEYGNVDLLIVGRGGGSLEDLWAFNEEIVAKAIYDSKIPVISAVGHEVDFTISDMVADVRAATPSEAAEIAVRAKEMMKEDLREKKKRLIRLVNNILKDGLKNIVSVQKRLSSPYFLGKIDERILRLDHLNERIRTKLVNNTSGRIQYINTMRSRVMAKQPVGIIEMRLNNLKYLNESIKKSVQNRITDRQINIKGLNERLKAIGPINVLKRGYSIVFKDDKIIKDASDLSIGDIVDIKFHSGSSKANIKEIKE